VVNDDDAPIGERQDRVARVARNDGHNSRPDGLPYAIDGHLELAGNQFVDFLLGMEVREWSSRL
jgi:hypothetical protein